MQSVTAYIVPIFSRLDMGSRIIVIMQHHFGITCGAACKVQQHIVVYVIFNSFKSIRILFDLFVKRDPSFFVAPDNIFFSDFSVFRCGFLNMVGYLALRCSYNVLYVRSLETVGVVFFHKLISCRDKNSADLAQCDCQKPELVVPFEY